jgi:V/A-type H+/Na+-transporting ATPase subunit K
MKQQAKIPVVASLAGILAAVFVAGMLLYVLPASAVEPAVRATVDPSAAPWAMIAAAIATAVSTLAAGYAVAVVGSAAVGALAEKPELLGRVLILVGLAEGIAIYGLIVSVLILNRLG